MPAIAALDIGVGTANVPPGDNAEIKITFASSPATPISAFALYLTNDTRFGVPSVAPGPGQPNLTCFVDNFGGGVSRVTGFVLSGGPITNGHVATLTFNVPPDLPAGLYPVVAPTTSHTNRPAGINPEVRALVTSELLAGAGANGLIHVSGRAYITEILPQIGSGYVLSFTGSVGMSYTIEAATNLTTPPDPTFWTPLTNFTVGPSGLFQFVDVEATNHSQRFYRALFP